MTAVRPPEYLPRLPYAALLLVADRVVLGDTFRFSRQGYQNRARIRTSQGGQWLSIPRAHAGRPLALRDVVVVDDGWRRRHARGVEAAYRMAPFYEHLAPSLAELWAGPASSLADLSARSVRWAAGHLGAACEIVEASALDGAPASLDDVWAVAGRGPLVTLPESAGRDARLDADVRALSYDEAARRQAFPGFEAGLSVLDLLMNYGPAAADRLRAEVTVGPPTGPAPPA